MIEIESILNVFNLILYVLKLRLGILYYPEDNINKSVSFKICCYLIFLECYFTVFYI